MTDNAMHEVHFKLLENKSKEFIGASFAHDRRRREY